MKKRVGLYACLIVFAVLAFAGSARAQQPDPYAAGWDAAWIAGDADLYQNAQEAYDVLGFSIYGQAFRDAFLNSPGYATGFGGGGGNIHAGAFQQFKIWYQINAVQQRALITRQRVVKGGTKRATKNFRALTKANRLRTAGDLIQQISLSADYSFASVEDKILDGKGHDAEASLFLSGKLGEQVTFGFGYAQDRYEITSNGRGYEQHTGSLDLVLSLALTERFSVGTFINCSFIDIEDEALQNNFIIEGDHYERWGFGLLASYNLDLGDRTNIGFTGSIASMNKSSLGRVLDDEDTAGVFMVDLNQTITDNFNVTVYTSYFGLLDRETTPEDPADNVPDGSYWTWGADLNFGLGKGSQLSVGYETSASDNDYEEDRLNLSLVLNF